MTKGKCFVIIGTAAVLLFCVLYLSSSYDIHWYNTFITIFAYYGIVSSLFTLYNWLRTPSEEPKHRDIPDYSRKSKTPGPNISFHNRADSIGKDDPEDVVGPV